MDEAPPPIESGVDPTNYRVWRNRFCKRHRRKRRDHGIDRPRNDIPACNRAARKLHKGRRSHP